MSKKPVPNALGPASAAESWFIPMTRRIAAQVKIALAGATQSRRFVRLVILRACRKVKDVRAMCELDCLCQTCANTTGKGCSGCLVDRLDACQAGGLTECTRYIKRGDGVRTVKIKFHMDSGVEITVSYDTEKSNNTDVLREFFPESTNANHHHIFGIDDDKSITFIMMNHVVAAEIT